MANFNTETSDRKECEEKLAELRAIADSDPDPARRKHALRFAAMVERHLEKHVKVREEKARGR